MTEDIIIFDIETRLQADAFQKTVRPFKKAKPEFTDFDPSTVKLGAMKDPEKIEAKIAAAKEKHAIAEVEAHDKWDDDEEDHFAKQADKAALYPGQSEICAIGWQLPGEEPVTLMIGDEGVPNEKAIVLAFLSLMRNVTESPMTAGGNFKFGFWSGNNNRNSYFDFLHIREAIRRHKIPVNHAIATAPGIRHSPWIDLAMDFMAHGAVLPQADGYPAFLSLDDCANYCGYSEAPEGFSEILAKDAIAVAGAEFGEAMEDPEQRDECRKYLVNDLALTRVVADNSFLNFVE